MDDRGNGLSWQIDVWDRLSQLYEDQVDPRFAPVVRGVIRRAHLRPGECVLDLGTGTGTVAADAASAVGSHGRVLAVDISPEMLALADMRAERTGARYKTRLGRAEDIPASDGEFDVVLASLSLMYVIDRARAASEIARVLRPGGRFIASVWAGPENCEIVLFQLTAGSFAPAPPVLGVGPGALANPQPFLSQLGDFGVDAQAESEVLSFEFPDFITAWDVLAGVTATQLSPERCAIAQEAVRTVMWREPQQSRRFENTTQYLTGVKR